MSNSLGSKLREIARRRKRRKRNTSSVWIIAVGRKRSTSPLSDTCPKHVVARRRREWIVRCTRYRLSLDLRVLARLETNRRRYVRLEEIARKTGLSPRYRSSCTRRPIYSLSLSLSLEDPRWICARWRNRGPIFTGELAYSIRWDREEGEEARGDRETRARAIFISRRAKWKRHRAFRAPRASQLGARELLVASMGRAILSLFLSSGEKFRISSLVERWKENLFLENWNELRGKEKERNFENR